MKKCSNPEHPHCTVWVMPGDTGCAHGHPQPELEPMSAPPPSSFDMISALRTNRTRDRALILQQPAAPTAPALQPHLHLSGYDPRAAGGRQTIRLDLRGMPAESATHITMQLRSALFPHGGERHAFMRTVSGEWRPVFVEFTSRGLEHGQYRVEVALQSLRHDNAAPARSWVCTLVIMVPRADATLTEIHQTFLSTHKNVRVMADDGAIARVNAQTAGGGRLDIDVTARNASIAHLNVEAQAGKIDLGFSTIAWDEDLIEIAVPAQPAAHTFPATAACLVNAAPETGAQRHVRLFALDEWVLGRFEPAEPEADILLSHFGEDGEDRGGLTRRLSARHAVIRRGNNGFEIEDVSRYGLLLDGVWPGKNQPVPLRLGMRIEFSASIKGIAVLSVTALLPNGVILHRADPGAQAECFCLLEPECHPGFPLPAWPAEPQAAVMPLLFHQHGGYWHLDPATGRETALSPATALDRLCQFAQHMRFAGGAYPELRVTRASAAERRQASAGQQMFNA